jgi:ribonuclease VapC
MVIDSSARIAIVQGESDAAGLAERLEFSDINRISAATWLESFIVVERFKNPRLTANLEEILLDAEVVIEPVTMDQIRIARQAYRDYGRDSGHPANLNFGDCFAYALAREKREPLLFKGDDFIHTDLRPAIR